MRCFHRILDRPAMIPLLDMVEFLNRKIVALTMNRTTTIWACLIKTALISFFTIAHAQPASSASPATSAVVYIGEFPLCAVCTHQSTYNSNNGTQHHDSKHVQTLHFSLANVRWETLVVGLITSLAFRGLAPWLTMHSRQVSALVSKSRSE